MTATFTTSGDIASYLGNEAESLLTYQAKLPKEMLHLPGSDFIERVFQQIVN